ncbi:MAG: hypothetical protein ACWGMZ_06675 [Thermoguttaceae bacterium]
MEITRCLGAIAIKLSNTCAADGDCPDFWCRRGAMVDNENGTVTL